ncbi:MAG: hypothetical protein KatS3mg081_1153 [Gemmatimonadales bacterium]|nr:hypothetical protein HRbin33_00395 [bacterium HR33]GIW51798.1 MAG: hypothetical protein KatS3mg081_1153 [Gemmatimonadales bacterium]
MNRLAAHGVPLLGFVFGACASGGGAVPAVPAPVLEHEQVRAVVQEALQADAASRSADTLYAIGASVVADGLPRTAPPRFAGIRTGGSVMVSNIALEITPFLAWATAEYRWLTPEGSLGALGRATFVLERLGGQWRIKHVHSSAIQPE